METHFYEHLPSDVSTIHLALFSNVSNTANLRNRLIVASTLPGEEGERERAAVNFAFIDANLITSRLHALTAIFQATLAQVQGSLRTKTIHSEVLWALNAGHNISEAIKRFGVSATTTSLLVVRICSPSMSADEFKKNACAVVDGDLVPLAELGEHTDWKTVRKCYKLNNDPVLSTSGQTSVQERAIIDQLVISLVAMKSVSA